MNGGGYGGLVLDQQLYSFNNSKLLMGLGESENSMGSLQNNTLSHNQINSSRYSMSNNVWTVGLPHTNQS